MLRTEVAEWELTPEEIAMIFAMKGWIYGGPDTYGVPNAEDIADVIEHLAEFVNSNERLAFSYRARLLVARHYEFNEMFEDGEGTYDGTLDVYLHVGTLPAQVGEAE